jgi:hypothetical protein
MFSPAPLLGIGDPFSCCGGKVTLSSWFDTSSSQRGWKVDSSAPGKEFPCFLEPDYFIINFLNNVL